MTGGGEWQREWGSTRGHWRGERRGGELRGTRRRARRCDAASNARPHMGASPAHRIGLPKRVPPNAPSGKDDILLWLPHRHPKMTYLLMSLVAPFPLCVQHRWLLLGRMRNKIKWGMRRRLPFMRVRKSSVRLSSARLPTIRFIASLCLFPW